MGWMPGRGGVLARKLLGMRLVRKQELRRRLPVGRMRRGGGVLGWQLAAVRLVRVAAVQRQLPVGLLPGLRV